MKYFTCCAILFLCFSCKEAPQNEPFSVEPLSENETTTYYLIRHAEKDRSNPEDEDPELNADGLLRAKKWASIFTEISFDAIYSSNYKRTIQTAEATATSQNSTTTMYDPNAIYESTFTEDTKGKTILVVGHSNTIPKLVNYLIEEEKYQDINDDVDGNLYIVTKQGDCISSTLLALE